MTSKGNSEIKECSPEVVESKFTTIEGLLVRICTHMCGVFPFERVCGVSILTVKTQIEFCQNVNSHVWNVSIGKGLWSFNFH